MKKMIHKGIAVIVAVMLMLPLAAVTMLPAAAQAANPPAPPAIYLASNNNQIVTIPLGTTFYVYLPSTRQLLGRVGVTTGIQLVSGANQGSYNFYEFKAIAKGNGKAVRILYTPSPGVYQIFTMRFNVV